MNLSLILARSQLQHSTQGDQLQSGLDRRSRRSADGSYEPGHDRLELQGSSYETECRTILEHQAYPGCGQRNSDKTRDFDMNMKLALGEPLAGPWRVTPIRDLVCLLFDPDRAHDGRPWILAVDGRSGSGKSTVAALLHRSVAATEIVHTDDVAWHHS